MKKFETLFEQVNERKALMEARSRGEEMEEFIVAGVNGLPYPKSQFGISDEAADKIVSALKRKRVSGKARILGADYLNVTDLWSQYWNPNNVPGATKTPKTDFIIGRQKISLKTGKSSQLMSGGRNESIATFYAAVDRLGLDLRGLSKRIENALHDMSGSALAASDLKSEIAKGKDKVVKAADAAHKILMADLRKLFEQNPDFAYEFAYEAMTGEVKFGGNEGTCTHFLTVSDDGSKVNYIPVTNEAYVRKVANKMKLTVRFKSTSEKLGGQKTGQYRYWSAISLVVDKMNEEVKAAEESGMLNENIVKRIIQSAFQMVKKYMKAAKDFIVKSVKNAMEFLGMEPIVSFNDTIDFSSI